MFKVGETIEIQVYDDAGNEQGTVLLGVRRHLGEHHGGRLVEAAFLAASDVYYHWWDEQRGRITLEGTRSISLVRCGVQGLP